ncbi:hypothetical protein, partial [Azospirillum argentinense]|uniref:hypothetical protein n=1 Tax=Azospirillum argentinense TaxID=2970906 RepID=UPI001B3B9EBE
MTLIFDWREPSRPPADPSPAPPPVPGEDKRRGGLGRENTKLRRPNQGAVGRGGRAEDQAGGALSPFQNAHG